MDLFPAETCVLCDLPWKNNRVCYDGQPNLRIVPRQLQLGSLHVSIDEAGRVTGVNDQNEMKFSFETGMLPSDGTLAFDSMLHILYFAAERSLVALSLDDGSILFRCDGQGLAGSPTLFEWLLPDGCSQQAVGFGDGAGAYWVCDRENGRLLWRAQTLGVVLDAAAHYAGYLYMTLRGAPCQALCLEARDGDLVWWNRGREEGIGGVVCDGTYCVLGKSGAWQRFSLDDGERL